MSYLRVLTASLKEKQKKSQRPVWCHHSIKFLPFSSLSACFPLFLSFFFCSLLTQMSGIKMKTLRRFTGVTVKRLEKRKSHALCVRPREQRFKKKKERKTAGKIPCARALLSRAGRFPLYHSIKKGRGGEAWKKRNLDSTYFYFNKNV